MGEDSGFSCLTFVFSFCQQAILPQYLVIEQSAQDHHCDSIKKYCEMADVFALKHPPISMSIYDMITTEPNPKDHGDYRDV
jgi:hypothetical protein